jgi:prepilin signal peptidase PulO-like enzyme (type II secretory pathway)
MNTPALIVAAVFGFLIGILCNLLADYLPARRHHHAMRHDLFASRAATPPAPRFWPRAPLPLWSGTLAALARRPLSDPPRHARRIALELGLALVFALITSRFGTWPNLPFLYLYAAALALIAVIDIEHRWILGAVLWPLAAGGLAEALWLPRIALSEALEGALLGLACGVALYLGGVLFSGALRRRGRTAFGGGDVLLAGVGGLLLGWGGIIPALIIALLSGGAAAVVLILTRMAARRRGKRVRRQAAIPYAPHIALGITAMLYAGDAVLNLYFYLDYLL